jgi:chemotaxis signal transduction protein
MGNNGEVSDSPSPVMTFEAGGRWLAVRVDQVDRVAVTSRLWPVPLASRYHAGLFDAGTELVPVMHLDDAPSASATEHLLALLHVRGATMGLAIERAGRVYDRWSFEDARDAAPEVITAAGAVPAHSSDHHFWLVDADRLFADEPDGARPRPPQLTSGEAPCPRENVNGAFASGEAPLSATPSRGP